MNPKDQPVGNDPTIMGNEKPRREPDSELPRHEKVQAEDPRNGMNRPADDTNRKDQSADEDDE